MVQAQRLIFLALAIAWTIFRLVRYVRISGLRRSLPAIPPSAGTQTASPIEPAGAPGVGLARNLLAAAVFIPGSVAIWSLLFMVPAIEAVPPLVRMTAGVLATLYLIHLARGAATRFSGTGQRGDAGDNNPIK